MLADEIGRGRYAPGSLARLVQETLDQYAVMMALGSVRKAKLSTARDYGEEEGVLAHAYILMMPKHVVRRMCGPRARVPQRTAPDESLSGVLTLDGTNLKITEERADFVPHPGSERVNQCMRLLAGVRYHEDRFKAYSRPGNDYYVDVVSCMTRDVRQPDGLPAYQLYFSRGGTYGVPFADLVRDPDIRMTPCVECTAAELEAVARALDLEPRAPPLRLRQETVRAIDGQLRAALPGWTPHLHGLRYGRASGADATLLVLTQEDVFAEDIHRALERMVDAGEARAVSIYPEAFTDTLYGAVVTVHHPVPGRPA